MSGRCTCNTVLVEDALFCHRCGKPQREDLIEREAVAAAPAVVETPAAPSAAAYDSRRANRSSVFAALTAFLATFVTGSLFGSVAVVVVLVISGALTVYLYRLNVPAAVIPTRLGARMGWMTGLYAFVLSVLGSAPEIWIQQEELWRKGLEELARLSALNPDVHEAMTRFGPNTILAVYAGLSVLLVFISFTALSSLGAALTAHFNRTRD